MKDKIKEYFPAIVVDYFTKGVDRSKKAKKNILYSFLLKGMSILTSLLLVPLTINYINPTRYGIWLTLSSIIGWLSFFDIGFGNGFRNKFAEAIAKGQYRLARIYVSTTYAILGIIIALVLICFLLVNPFLNWSKILNANTDMSAELSVLALIVFVFFCLQFVLQLVTTVITANQQPARAAAINLLGNVISLALIFLLTKTMAGNLVYLGTILAGAPVIVLIFSSLLYFRGSLKMYAPRLRLVNFKFAGRLMGLGVKFFIIQISALFLFQTNNIIISQILGPEQVTPYNIAFKYFGICHMLFLIVLSPFWTAYTDAYYRDDFSWIKRTTTKLVKMWSLLLILILFLLAMSDFSYLLWIGPSIQVPFQLSVSCAFYVAIITWSSIFVNFINGVGKISMQLYLSIFIALINLPLSLFLIKGLSLGVTGLVYSNCFCLGFGAVLATIQYYKIVNKKDFGIWSK